MVVSQQCIINKFMNRFFCKHSVKVFIHYKIIINYSFGIFDVAIKYICLEYLLEEGMDGLLAL